MKTLHKTLFVTLLVASAAPALAAGSLDIKVIGTITPAACTPTAGGNGTFDYGIIPAKSLSPTDFTVLAQKTQPLTITCDSEVKMALNFTDARSSSKMTPTGAQMTTPDGTVETVPSGAMWFKGLGMAGSAKIGAYSLGIVPASVKVDTLSSAVDVIKSSDNGLSWSVTGVGRSGYIISGSKSLMSFAAIGTTDPVAFKTLTGDLVVQAVINKASALDLTQDIALDGQGTLQIVYL